MLLMLVSLALFVLGGVASLLAWRSRQACRIGAVSAVAASVAGLIASVQAVMQGPSAGAACILAPLPMGQAALSLDALSALFLIPVFILAAVCGVYGADHLEQFAGKRRLGVHWFYYNLLAAGMVLMLLAADAFLFLIAWEIMSLVPFFLITLHDDDEKVRAAAWVYLVAAHLGALFLLAFFAALSTVAGGELSFTSFTQLAASDAWKGSGINAGALFVLALIGFGAKSGFMPMHVWMPVCYPAAPSHVAAFMSGALSNTGIYGILRALTFLGYGELWWAYLLMGLGAFSGFVGILLALAQSDVKRSLAYSSVENMGIMCLMLGVSLFCLHTGRGELALLVLTGCLVHMINHGLFKGMLFLCAGAVHHVTGTMSLRLMGGLQKRMPVTGACFAIGAAAIAALPPFNGFAGEFLAYVGMATGGAMAAHMADPASGVVFWLALVCLAGIGGFALFCFARVYAMTFLGTARSHTILPDDGVCHDPARAQRWAMVTLAGLCVCSGLLAPELARSIAAIVSPFTADMATSVPVLGALDATVGSAATDVGARFALATENRDIFSILGMITRSFVLLIILLTLIFLLRRRLLRGRVIESSPTWDCGYLAPSARMQYTGGSFAQPVTVVMKGAMRPALSLPVFTEYFPKAGKASLVVGDWILDGWFVPLFTYFVRMANWCKRLQHGRLNAYILYTLVTLVALLAWKLG